MSDDVLAGIDYRAVLRLSNGDDTEEYAAIGETCERVPVESLLGLLAHGYIAPVSASGDRAVPAAHDTIAAAATDEEQPF